MAEEKILWKPLDTTYDLEFVKDGWSSPERIGIAGAAPGSNSHENLEELAIYLESGKNASKRWSVARIHCNPEDYEPDTRLPKGWYIMLRGVISDTGFVPLKEAKYFYLKS